MRQLPYELWKIILEFKYEKFKKELNLFNAVQNIYICGGKGTGKTTLVKDLLFSNKSSIGIIIGNLDDYENRDYDNTIYANFDILLDRSMSKINKFCIIDNITNYEENPEIFKIYCNNRHLSLLNILCDESFLIKPRFRANTECFCIFNGLTIKDKNKLYDTVFPNVSKQEFNRMLDCIPLYNCLVIHQYEKNKMYYYYKAKIYKKI
jgi:hypothetical protein